MSSSATRDPRTKRQMLEEIEQLRARLHAAEQLLSGLADDSKGDPGRQPDLLGEAEVKAALRESEEKYRLLFQNMAEGFAIYELIYDDQGNPVDWRVLEVNDAYTVHTGVPRSWIVGRCTSELFPEAIPVYLPLFAEVVATQQAREFETYSKSVNRHLRINCFPAGPHRFANTIVDITRRKEAEAALRAYDIRARALIDVADESIWLFGLHGEILAANATAASRMGMTVEEVMGKRWPDLLPPDLVASRGKWVEAVLHTGDSVHFQDERDGTIFAHSAHPVRDESERITSVAFFSRDITALKRAEEELLRRSAELEAARNMEEDERRLLEAVMEALPVGVAIIDIEGGIVRSNSGYEGIWGSPRPSTQSLADYSAYKAWWADTGEPVLPQEWASAMAVLKGETIVGQMLRIQRFDGSKAYVINSASPVRNAAGSIVGCAVAIQDISLLKQVEEELKLAKEAAEKATQAKSRFLANMSHELRTPMTGVLSMLELLLSGAMDDGQREYLELAGISAKRLLAILNDILDLSKIEADKLTLESKAFHLAVCVEDAVNLFLPLARSKGVELSFSIAAEVPFTVQGDPLRLTQVLTNLLGNAVKFTDKGRIELAVSSDPHDSRRLVFSVSDTGIGIAEEKQELLFKPFIQVNQSHSTRYGGTGLGLAISMQLVEKMGGCISCTSSEGKGTTFSFSIPLPASASIALPDYDAGLFAPPSVALQHPPRLLIAEDNEVVRFAYGKLFRQEGVEVEFAVNGKDVLEKWATGQYDLIIMDVQMPVVDGIEATRIIRKKELETGGHIPIIAMTGYAFREDLDRCLEAGMDGHLCKPVEFRRMLNAVRNALNC